MFSATVCVFSRGRAPGRGDPDHGCCNPPVTAVTAVTAATVSTARHHPVPRHSLRGRCRIEQVDELRRWAEAFETCSDPTAFPGIVSKRVELDATGRSVPNRVENFMGSSSFFRSLLPRLERLVGEFFDDGREWQFLSLRHLFVACHRRLHLSHTRQFTLEFLPTK